MQRGTRGQEPMDAEAVGRQGRRAWHHGERVPHGHRRLPKKNEIKPWLQEEWCIPKPSAEFVERMEDVLEVYKQPYDPFRPVVCLDETNRQLIGETRQPIPMAKGQPQIYDYEYVRNGVADIFMMFEPLAARRYTEVTETRTKIDFAYRLQELSDRYYPHAERIILVMDNLNTHTLASLYEAFAPEEARRIAERFEIHYTPKHGSWLNMAETEIGVMSRQCLSRRIPTRDDMAFQVKAWTCSRNAANLTVDWQFTTEDARIKLKHLYPKY